MKLIACIVALLAGLGVGAQGLITIGSKHKMYASTLREEREYWVYLPPGYGNTKYLPAKYPVIYLLDGDNNFESVAGIQQYLSKGIMGMIPQMIIVGILNTDRTRDLTPTHAPQARPGMKGILYETSGGNKNFIQFLRQELIPHIDSGYSTTGYKILIGHSFAGLTALNIFLNHNKLFNAYLALDPSLWWDNKKLVNSADSILGSTNFSGCNLFVALANKPVTSQDTTTDHQRAIQLFTKSILPAHPGNGLRWNWKYYEDDDHGVVSLPATYDGLKFLFKGYQAPVKETLAHPEVIPPLYKKLSAQLGYSFTPEEALIDSIGRFCMAQNKVKSAVALFEMNRINYPASSNVYISLGEAYLKTGDLKKALECYLEAQVTKPGDQSLKEKVKQLENIM